MPKCPVCRVTAHLVVDDLFRCSFCGHAFQDPPTVKVDYGKEYVGRSYDTYSTTDVMNHLRLGLVAGFVKPGQLLDVGYGNGSFIRLASKYGYEAYGNDVNPTEYEGVRNVPMDHSRQWSGVTFFDSLEHFPNLDPVRKLTDRADCVIVSLPATPAAFLEDPKSWKHYKPGEHLHYFSLDSLDRLVFPMRRQVVSHAEDVIRGRLPSGEPNIHTVVYKAL